MPRLRNVHFFPYSGWPDLPWGKSLNDAPPFQDDVQDVDAAARSSRAVTEALSTRLSARQIETRRAQYRAFLAAGSADQVEFESFPDRYGSAQGFLGRIRVPADFRLLLPAQRSEAILEAVHQLLTPLARAEGWSAALDVDVQAVRADAFRCTWVGPWRRTPDRTTAVRIAADIRDDGYGRWRLEIGDPDGEVLRRSAELFGWTWIENFVRMTKELRFIAGGRAVVGRGSIGLDTVTTIDLDTGEVVSEETERRLGANPVPLRYPGMPERATPEIRVIEPPRITIFGGAGPISPEVTAYREAAHRLGQRLETEPWLDWWQRIGVEEVSLPIWFQGDAVRIVVRRSGKKLSAVRYRPPASVPDSPLGAEVAARADLAALIERIRQRFDLPEPPEALG